MRLRILSITALVFALFTGVFFCTKVVNPIDKYENVNAELKADRIFWKTGARDSISVRVFPANLVDSMVVDFGENGEDTTMIRSNGPDHPTDTFTIAHTYTLAGVKPIWRGHILKMAKSSNPIRSLSMWAPSPMPLRP
jgi:hypothetical protein